jgi:hypothetical protein
VVSSVCVCVCEYGACEGVSKGMWECKDKWGSRCVGEMRFVSLKGVMSFVSHKGVMRCDELMRLCFSQRCDELCFSRAQSLITQCLTVSLALMLLPPLLDSQSLPPHLQHLHPVLSPPLPSSPEQSLSLPRDDMQSLPLPSRGYAHTDGRSLHACSEWRRGSVSE